MYLEYFGLSKPPFRITPDTHVFFEGSERGPTLSALIYAIENSEGIIKVVGEVGTGKTMLCRMLPTTLLERYASNLETDGHKLLPIALLEQPELDENLAARKIRQLRERITHSLYLARLMLEDIHAYLNLLDDINAPAYQPAGNLYEISR